MEKSVPYLSVEECLRPKFIFLWNLLAFQAGFINCFGFLACQRFVSHVTGFSTHIGLAFMREGPFLMFKLMLVPTSFILGAWANGKLTVVCSAKGQAPKYRLVIGLFPILLTLIMAQGALGVFGKINEDILGLNKFILLSLLSFLCGLQNSTYVTLTRGQIRTTHLTGISTDLGTDLALLGSGALDLADKEAAIKRNLMRVLTIFFFSVGAIFSVMATDQWEYFALLVPIMTSSLVAFAYFKGIFIKNKIEESQNPTS